MAQQTVYRRFRGRGVGYWRICSINYRFNIAVVGDYRRYFEYNFETVRRTVIRALRRRIRRRARFMMKRQFKSERRYRRRQLRRNSLL